jgi:hypothetical protein
LLRENTNHPSSEGTFLIPTPRRQFTQWIEAKAFPAGYQIPPHYRVRHDKIDAAGVITIRSLDVAAKWSD